MGDLINLNPPKPIADADIPASIARDTETAAALAAHLAATDPHPAYLTQNESDQRYGGFADIIFEATTPDADGNYVAIPHTLDISRVCGVRGVVILNTIGSLVADSFPAVITPGLEFCLSVTPTHIHCHNVPGNSFSILSRPVKITVSYSLFDL